MRPHTQLRHPHRYTHAHIHTRTHTHKDTHAHAHIHTHTAHTHTLHTHTHTHAPAHTHTHTHTYTRTPAKSTQSATVSSNKGENGVIREETSVSRIYQVQHAPELLSQEHLDEWRLLLQGLQQPLQQPLPQKTCDTIKADEHVSLLLDYEEQPTAKTCQPVPLHYAKQAIKTICQAALPVSAATPPNVISVATPVYITHSTDALAPSLPTISFALLHGRVTLHQDASQCDPHSAIVTI